MHFREDLFSLMRKIREIKFGFQNQRKTIEKNKIRVTKKILISDVYSIHISPIITIREIKGNIREIYPRENLSQ